VDQINLGGTFQNFDFRENRGINCSWPSELHDVVNVEYLESVLPTNRRSAGGGGIRTTRQIKFANFSLSGTLVAGQRVTPKPPIRLRNQDQTSVIRGRCIFAHANVDTPGTTRSVFDIFIQPADETEPRYSILGPGLEDKLIVPANTREQTILESGDLGAETVFNDGDFFTLDIVEAGAGSADGHVLVGFFTNANISSPTLGGGDTVITV
jgi:hypothetical protein